MRKRCQSCGQPFTAKRDTALYCSGRCRTAESRKRAAGRPDAVQSARPAVTAAVNAGRTVRLMVAPGVSVEVPPEAAATLAAHLPTPGDPAPFGADVRPRFLRDREAGVEQLLREQREAEEAAARTAELVAAQAELGDDQQDGATAGDRVTDVLRHGRGLLTAQDVRDAREEQEARAERELRDAEQQRLRDEADAAIELVSVKAATQTELVKAGADGTALARNALVLAGMLDEPFRHTGSALASLSREWRATLAAALSNGEAEEDPLAAARKAREARIAAAQAGANSGAV